MITPHLSFHVLIKLCEGSTEPFFFLLAFTFQLLLDKPWSQVSSLLPPGSCLQFLPRIGFSNPAARRFFIECCCAFRKSICAQEKLPTNVYEYALGGARTHETDIYTRLENNLIRHRGDRLKTLLIPVITLIPRSNRAIRGLHRIRKIGVLTS